MNPVRPLFSFALILALFTVAARAALPPRSIDDLKSAASDIVTGEVKAVYTSQRDNGKGFVDTLYVIEFSVKTAEKGDAKVGQLIYARGWKPSSRPRGWAGPQGQNRIPAVGDQVRIYLMKGDDGGLDLVTPNGVADAAPAAGGGK